MRSIGDTESCGLSQRGLSLGRASREDFDVIPREEKEKDQ